MGIGSIPADIAKMLWFGASTGIPMAGRFALGAASAPFTLGPAALKLLRASWRGPTTLEHFRDLALYGPMAGLGVYAAGNRSLKNMQSQYGTFQERVNKAQMAPLDLVKTSALSKEAAFNIAEMLPHMIALHGVSAGVEGLSKATAAPGSGIGNVIGYNAYKAMFPGLSGMMSYTAAPEKALENTFSSFGKEIGKQTATSLKGIITNIMDKNTQVTLSSPRRKMILEQLRREDLVIGQAPIQVLLEAYHSMAQVAPILSTDKNAVKSFLRTVATSPEGGIDWNTMKGLADAEKSIRSIKSESVNVTL